MTVPSPSPSLSPTFGIKRILLLVAILCLLGVAVSRNLTSYKTKGCSIEETQKTQPEIQKPHPTLQTQTHTATNTDAHTEKGTDTQQDSRPYTKPDTQQPPPPDITQPPPPPDIEQPPNLSRRDSVKEAYIHAWNSYKKYSFGHDELEPQTHSSFDWLDMGLTIVDSIDTMYMMGLDDIYEESRQWIDKNLDFNEIHRGISVFETTIRVVGGLLSIYELTGDKMFLDKAESLGLKLMFAFNSSSGIPFPVISLSSGKAESTFWGREVAFLSEIGTLQMEFETLSKLTGNQQFSEKAMRVYDILDGLTKPDGLYPVLVNINTGKFQKSYFWWERIWDEMWGAGKYWVTLGSRGDSFYEYLLKVWLLTGKKNDQYRRMYEESMSAVIAKLVKKSTPSGLTYLVEKVGHSVVERMDHLACFVGGMFALGAYHNATQDAELHMTLGKEITRTCHEFYMRQITGLSPDVVQFSNGVDFCPESRNYILRPETVESYFVLYWITNESIYQEWGWEAFQAIQKYSNTPYGYCGVNDVTKPYVEHDNIQQSFFLAETLKYLYLLFSPRDTILSLDKWVFNTEAHPLRIFDANNI